MSFGQPSGPQASSRQLRDLVALLESLGYAGFKEARGPFQLSQRQAGGRFARDEAEALLVRLQSEVDAADDPPGAADRAPTRTPALAETATEPAGRSVQTRRQRLARQLEQVPEDLLVAELRRRGWSVDPPGG